MLSVGQIFGSLILGATVVMPGLALGGFHGGTRWSIFGWLCVSLVGGFFGGLLLAPKHRISGAIGGVIGAPLALLALYFYSKDRDTIYRAESAIVSLVAALPGFAAFFVLRFISDAVFPARKEEDDAVDDDEGEDEDAYERPRRSKRRRDEDDDDDEDEPRRGRKRRRDRDDDDEKPRHRRGNEE